MKTIKNLLWIIVTASFFFSCKKEQSVVAVEGLKLSESAIEMQVGESRVLRVTITPAAASNKHVKWSSSNKTVASVEDGEITAHKTGATTISVKSEDGGYKASCMVTVVNEQNPDNPTPPQGDDEEEDTDMHPDDLTPPQDDDDKEDANIHPMAKIMGTPLPNEIRYISLSALAITSLSAVMMGFPPTAAIALVTLCKLPIP